MDAFARLSGMAFHARQVGEAEAFLIALDQDADYDNPNFRWLRARYDRFVYIDRVVVADHARGRGLAQRLYSELFAAAAKAGHTCVLCEVNSAPPNLASDRFHLAQGFSEIGSAEILGGEKTVRYLMREV
jgi:predicted GNAT superfamily acetyltransferase